MKLLKSHPLNKKEIHHLGFRRDADVPIVAATNIHPDPTGGISRFHAHAYRSVQVSSNVILEIDNAKEERTVVPRTMFLSRRNRCGSCLPGRSISLASLQSKIGVFRHRVHGLVPLRDQ